MIKLKAHEDWKDTNPVSHFVVKCYVKAIIHLCKSKGYMIRDGKIYKI